MLLRLGKDQLAFLGKIRPGERGQISGTGEAETGRPLIDLGQKGFFHTERNGCLAPTTLFSYHTSKVKNNFKKIKKKC